MGKSLIFISFLILLIIPISLAVEYNPKICTNETNVEVLTVDYCYQESANVSTICGGLDTGNYFVNGFWGSGREAYLGIDENYITFALSNNGADLDDSIYINYTKPSGSSVSSIWQVLLGSVGNGDVPVNLSIPLDCWNKYNDKLSFRFTSISTDLPFNGASCYNGTWNILWDGQVNGTGTGDALYEEAMYWNITTYNTTYNLVCNNNTYNDYCYTNETLKHNMVINGDTITIDENCVNGCDFQTNSCNPSPLMQYAIVGGIVIGIILIGTWFIGLFKRG